MTPAPSDPKPQTLSPEPFAAAGGHGFLRHAAVVSGLTFASRLLGLVRDRVMGSVFGTSPWHAAFVIGFIVPNLFRRLFGEGALAAAFVPHYARLVETDPALARRFASRCVAGLAVALAGLTLLGETGLWFALQNDAVAGSEKATSALQMTALMLPYMPLVCGVAFLGAVLQVHHRFGPAAAAPVILNVAMIAAAIGAGFLSDATGGTHGRNGVTLVALSVLVAGVVQLAWLGRAVRTTAPLGREGVALRDPATSAPVRAMLRTMVPMVIGLGVFQINTLFDQLIAYTLAAPADAGPDTLLHFPAWTGWAPAAYPIQTAAVVPLNFAQRLYQFPLGVFGIALATAIFPALARAAAAFPAKTTAPRDSDFADTLRRGLRLSLLIGLPSAAGLVVLATPVCRVVFEAGAFTTDDAARTAAVLTGYAAGLWAYTLTHVLTRAFYALDDAKTPLRVSLGLVGFNLTLNLTLVWPLGVAGLAWSTAISAALQVALLLVLLRRRVETPVDRAVLTSWARTVLLVAAMTAALWLAVRGIDPLALSRTASAGLVAAAIAGSVAFVFVGAWALRMPELGWLRRRS